MSKLKQAQKTSLAQANEEEVKQTQRRMEELELKKLIRQDRLNREINDKEATTEKQKHVINALTLERDNLTSYLKVMQTPQRCLVDTRQAEDITDLFGQGDTLDLEIAREKKYIADLEVQIRKESSRLETERRTVQSSCVNEYTLTEETQRADRTLKGWQSRLHVEQVQLSKSIRENAELRKRIEVLLQGKSRFNQLFEELMQKLDRGKKIMADIVEQSTAQFKKKEELARKNQALKERDAADLAKRQEEMQDLQMKLSEDKNLMMFRYKVMEVRQKLSESAKETRRATLQRQAEAERLRDLLQTWNKIRAETKLSESAEVCEQVTRREAQNFSLFNYNNELCYQLESLTQRNSELLRKVEDEQEIAYQWEDDQERAVRNLEEMLHVLEVRGNDLSDDCEAERRLLDRLMEKIKTLFDMIKCDRSPLDELLGENQEVTWFNYPLYLRLVESRLVVLVGQLPCVANEPWVTGNVRTADTIVAFKKQLTRPCTECEGNRKQHLPSIAFEQTTTT